MKLFGSCHSTRVEIKCICFLNPSFTLLSVFGFLTGQSIILQEKIRRLLNDIQSVIPRARLDLDRVIDNKINLELNEVIDKLKKKISDDKEVLKF